MSTRQDWRKASFLFISVFVFQLIVGAAYVLIVHPAHLFLTKDAENTSFSLVEKLQQELKFSQDSGAEDLQQIVKKGILYDNQLANGIFKIQLFDVGGNFLIDSDGRSANHAKKDLWAAEVAKNGIARTLLRKGNSRQVPQFFSVSYVPIQMSNRTVSVAKVFVDQTKRLDDIKTALLHASAGVALIVFIAFSVPAIALLFRSRQKSKLDQELAKSERQFRKLVENSRDMICRYDRQHRRLYVNPSQVALTGATADELLGKTPMEFPGEDYCILFEDNLAQVFDEGTPLEFEMEWTFRGSKKHECLVQLTPEFANDGSVESVLAVLRDVTELRASRQRLYEMAYYDSLTSLPNRTMMNDRLSQAIQDASRRHSTVAVLLLDLDRFKSVNDSLGHDAGDELLQEVTRRLTSVLRSEDTVARLGGDEFVIIVPDVAGRAELSQIAQQVLHSIGLPCRLQGTEIFISGSIGIALFPSDAGIENDLLRHADAAMYEAKRSGRNAYRFYEKRLTTAANKRLLVETGLRHAVTRNELELHFQPKVSFADGRIIGSEALLRWRSHQLGFLSPNEFIGVAEDLGLIIEIGEWVLREACTAARDWNINRSATHKVAINLSVGQFRDKDLVKKISVILAETGCRPEWIELEITETLLLNDSEGVLETLTQLRQLGITIAIDDFGTGYSSLSYLANFPIDILKIDRSFVQAIATDSRRAELVKVVLSLAACLGQKVVAEGVETPEQASFLREHDCDYAQGWLFSRALPRKDMEFMIGSSRFGSIAGKTEKTNQTSSVA